MEREMSKRQGQQGPSQSGSASRGYYRPGRRCLASPTQDGSLCRGLLAGRRERHTRDGPFRTVTQPLVPWPDQERISSVTPPLSGRSSKSQCYPEMRRQEGPGSPALTGLHQRPFWGSPVSQKTWPLYAGTQSCHSVAHQLAGCLGQSRH